VIREGEEKPEVAAPRVGIFKTCALFRISAGPNRHETLGSFTMLDASIILIFDVFFFVECSAAPSYGASCSFSVGLPFPIFFFNIFFYLRLFLL